MIKKEKPVKKPVAKVVKAPKKEKPAEPKKVHAPAAARYIFAIGRRKTATARVKMTPGGEGKIVVNSRTFADYFPSEILQKVVLGPQTALGLERAVDTDIRVSGGGIRSQALAAALGLARALVMVEPNRKTVLKKQGMMTRDARKKERKKPGLKRARRAPQWQKR